MEPPAKRSKTVISKNYGRINPSKFMSLDMLDYVLKKASPTGYYKLIKSSKYFVANKPPLIVEFRMGTESNDLDNLVRDWRGQNRTVDLRDKFLWIKGCVSIDGHVPKDFDFLRQVYRCDLTELLLENATLSIKELQLLMESKTIEYLDLFKNTFLHPDGKKVALEEILLMTPKVEKLTL